MISEKRNKVMYKRGFSVDEAKEVAESLKIDFDKVKYTVQALCDGMNEELEHAKVTKRRAKTTARIALDHLEKDPLYYEKLAKIEKAIGLPMDADSGHMYVYSTGYYSVRSFWWKDNFGNYWRYTNAPVGHPDFDPKLGEPLIHPDQPMPHLNPEFYTEDGFKRNQALPAGASPHRNPAYDPSDPTNVWFEVANVGNVNRYIYKESDVRENLDLWVQYQLRLVDASLLNYRKRSAELFKSKFDKDRIVGLFLMLIDQAMFSPEELIGVTVSELSFSDKTVHLRSRKLVCDDEMYAFLLKLVMNKNPMDQVFTLDTFRGRKGIGYNYLYSVLEGLRMDPVHLLAWHANHIFSRIVHRMAVDGIPSAEVEERAYDELAAALGTTDDVRPLIDFKLLDTLLTQYVSIGQSAQQELAQEGQQQQAAPQPVSKALTPALQDKYAVYVISTSFDTKHPDEVEFSEWLHTEPLHDVSPIEQQAIDEAIAAKVSEALGENEAQAANAAS